MSNILYGGVLYEKINKFANIRLLANLFIVSDKTGATGIWH